MSGRFEQNPGCAEATANYVDADYRFDALEGASHWLPEEVPEQILPTILDHLAVHNTLPPRSSSAG
ncbi:alpha/beta fold hydrolase [Nocardia sp. CA-119907]|uniref:alpha/beta fold hydrolase n=1 Tax=Nocardia sp. CA-119907 TaxID=3239973 RepID=UPI003D992239